MRRISPAAQRWIGMLAYMVACGLLTLALYAIGTP